MRHHIFEHSDKYPIAILIKGTAFNKTDLLVNYVEPLRSKGIPLGDIIAFDLPYNEAGKAPVAHIKAYLEELMPALKEIGSKLLYVADANFFKVIAGVSKADVNRGYVLPCKIKGYEDMEVVLGVNHQALIYNPEIQSQMTHSLQTVVDRVQDTYSAPGSGIIQSASFPESLEGIKEALEQLHQYPELTCDIEAFSLRFWEAGIGTIAFAWDKHHGLAFPCDYKPFPEKQEDGRYGRYVPNPEVRALLLDFFTNYKGKLVFHKADYDVGVIIFTLWMQHLLDQRGLLTGLDIMCRDLDDTKIIIYLATNTAAGNVLGLKPRAQEFAGNWSVEVEDISRQPLDKLLQYNLVDSLSTWYVKEKYYPIMVRDCQLPIYQDMMLPSLKLIIQLEMTGMPLNPVKVQQARVKLTAICEKHLDTIAKSSLVQKLNGLLRISEWEKDFEGRRSKAKNPHKILPKDISAFDSVTFNPNSNPQLQRLFYEVMGLPVIDLTDTKQPATGADTIEKLINHTQVPEQKVLMSALIGYAGANKILTTFIPAFEASIAKADGMVWLHGSFNLGGTVSGRLSSSDPKHIGL
jgi:DNA polymerase-1